MSVPLAEIEVGFILAAQRHLVPGHRQVFVERLASGIAAHPDPGPGTVNAILRTVWSELWTPPLETERLPPRWDRSTPSFDRVSRAARAPVGDA